MEGLFYFVCSLVVLGVFCCFVVFLIEDKKRTQNENLRRETIKNTLQEICIKLEDISKGIWYEK